ncbi:hypothetical protein K450DRAFT_235380 [Umbelopsis ramanniana AG]|uniref:Uncharacterized protein n=1 Tax=Umbelopsis ramanniana AG TaxID=1314678 RepID=A0AAD5EDH3_UMBRA|nr:uncharacterized protein K450DRAFT_235380 [Umbelopsis ramanniana AG]KAI8580946.1 hypothetical protein K450DRAFT_235380 [Umbelopsis ramanniana AG]
MNPVYTAKGTPPNPISPCIIYLGAASTLCILIILAYHRYHIHRTDAALDISTRSYTFYEYNRPPRLQITRSSYGATKETVQPPSPERVVEWIKTRDKMLSKYAAVESMV